MPDAAHLLLRALPWLLAGGAMAGAGEDAGVAIYMQGLSVSGAPIQARVSADVPLTGSAAACTNCHRASGLGTAEGRARSLPIVAASLFAERPPPAARPAYDDATLLRAITQGVSASGRVLDPLMPRYQFDAADGAALLAHLHRLGSEPAPGVTQDEVVLATVVWEGAPIAQREATTRVLERFVQLKNAGARQEARRAEVARRHPFGERHDRGWKRWRLVTWQLHGSPGTWAGQLREQYDKDPPFLLFSGTAGEHWREVHGFCEQQRLPCILPMTTSPPDAQGDFYSVYFNAGARLDGAVIARHVAQRAGETPRRIVVARQEDAEAQAALAALAAASGTGSNAAHVEERVLPRGRPDAGYWMQLLRQARPDVLVMLADADRLEGLDAALRAQGLVLPLYTSATFTRWSPGAALLSQPQLWHVQAYNFAAGNRAAFARESQWLRSQKLDQLDPLYASQALFACHIVGEQLAALTGNYSREYFIEGLEHMLDSTNMTSLVPRTTLGQGQRFISRGAFVLPASSLVRGDGAGATWVEN